MVHLWREYVLVDNFSKVENSTLHFKTFKWKFNVQWLLYISKRSSGDWTRLQLQLQLQCLQQFTLQNRHLEVIEAAVETSLHPSLCQVWRSIEAAVKVGEDSLKKEQLNEVNG